MSIQKEVWVIGSPNTNADKSIGWLDEFPNFSDPDVLIINMNSLTSEVLSKFGIQKINELNQAIVDKFRTGGTVIIITSQFIQSVGGLFNYWISPIYLETVSVPEGKRLRYNFAQHPFSKYLEQVDSFSFYLQMGPTDDFQKRIGNIIVSMVSSRNEYLVTDNSGHIIGIGYGNYVQKWASTSKGPSSEYNGDIIFLPPTKKISNSEGINIILQKYGKQISQEPIPEWIQNVKINGLEKFSSKLEKLGIKKRAVQKEMDEQYQKLKNIFSHVRLLYARDLELEEAVYNAFKLLGFTEITKKRDNTREDWIFEFKFANKKFHYGVIEVKGSDTKSKQLYLTQCSKWVDEIFHNENKLAKGILVINQFRKLPYTESKEKRTSFEPNELEYAKMKGICIIPSYVLFELVNSHLAGKKKSRKALEFSITRIEGVLHNSRLLK